MASKVGDLRIELSAETASFRRDMDKARSDIRSVSKQMTSDLDGFSTKIGATSAAIGSLTAVIGALATSAAVGMFVSTITEFERLNASLKTITGSSEGADQAMSWLRDFAADTPFQLSQVVTAFTKLKALGLEPSRAALESYGNTSAAMGKDLNQMIEAVADAATGEFERLKDFGIKAKSEGDKVSFTFQGVTTTVKKNAKEIEGYLMRIGENQFAGAMADQMDTLNGKLSNLKDATDALVVALGDTGLRDVFKNLVGDTVEQMEELTNWFKDNPDTVRAWGNTLMNVLDTVATGVWTLSSSLMKMGGYTIAAAAAQAVSLAEGDLKAVKAIGDQWMADILSFNAKADQNIFDMMNRQEARKPKVFFSGVGKDSGAGAMADQSLWQNGGAGGSAGGGDAGGVTKLKDQAALVKQIYAELSAETQKTVALNQEMYEQLGTGAETVAKDEVRALMERAQKWQEAGADISDINEWLYKNIEGLRLKWAENGEQDAVDYLDSVTALHRNLVEEYTKMEQEAVSALDQIGVRMDLLDKQDITLDIYLADHASAQIEAIIARVRTMQSMQELGLSVSTSQAVGSSGSSFGNTFNFNQNVSRSDVSNIVSEAGRQGDRG
jgi:hypothetical protein